MPACWNWLTEPFDPPSWADRAAVGWSTETWERGNSGTSLCARDAGAVLIKRHRFHPKLSIGD